MNFDELKQTKHLKERLESRGITIDEVKDAINNPARTIYGVDTVKIMAKKRRESDSSFVTVVLSKDKTIIITAYRYHLQRSKEFRIKRNKRQSKHKTVRRRDGKIVRVYKDYTKGDYDESDY